MVRIMVAPNCRPKLGRGKWRETLLPLAGEGARRADEGKPHALMRATPPHPGPLPRKAGEGERSNPKYFARIKQVGGIERGFERAHRVERGFAVLIGEIVDLLLADA